jgi:hypothetical protein
MKPPRSWVIYGVLGLALLTGGQYAWRARQTSLFFLPESLFSRFPAEDATALRIDVVTLRRAGLLSASKASLEPEYKTFVDGTGFDYRRDLDQVVASFSNSGNYFIARGRFDWNKLRDYALHQGGSCYEQLCRMQGSRPDRHISFLPLRNDAIALAVGADDLAASRLTRPGQPVTAHLPDAPVWFSVPGVMLRRPGAVVPGIRMMLSALNGADKVIVTVTPGASGIEAHLETICHTTDEAKVLASQLRSTTSLLKEAMVADTGPEAQEIRSDDLARALAAGVFEQNGLRVTGRWPVSKTLIDSLTSGI